MQARAVLEYSSSLTSGPSWGLDTFPHFCKLPSSVIPFSRKRIRASEPTRVLSPVFSSPGSLALILLWLPLQSALCSIPIPLFSFRKAAFQPYRSIASHQNQHIFRERESGCRAETPWHLENAHQPKPHLIPPLQFQYSHKTPSSEINAFALRNFVRVIISAEMLLGLVKIFCALVVLQIFMTLK